MGVAEYCHPEASAPPHALCVVCSEAALQRCEECFDEAEGHLYLCAKDACFDASHPERQRRKHRMSLAAWNSKAKWKDKCCETHKGSLLALWCYGCAVPVCTLCCSHGEHNGHETSLVTDAWKELQEQLRKTMGHLEKENVRIGERLQRLTEEQEELRSGKGAVGEARRVLHGVKAEFLAKVEALDAELDETAVKWCRLAAEEHEQLAQRMHGVQSLVDRMRATCAEENEEDAQRVAIAHAELCGERDLLGHGTPVSVRAIEVKTDTLREAVAGFCVHAVETVETISLCAGCGGFLERGAECADCAKTLRAFKEGCSKLRTAGGTLQANKAVVLAAVATDGLSLEFANSKLKANKEVVMAAVRQNGLALQHADHSLQLDEEVVVAALAENGDALKYADATLRATPDVVLAAVAQSGMSVRYASESLPLCQAVALAAVTTHGWALKHASKFQADKQVVAAAVGQNGLALQFASDELRANKDVVTAAVAQHGEALQFASEKLRANRDVVMAAVAQDGDALQHADPKLRADRPVVLAAVAQSGQSLQYASEELKGDLRVVMTAHTQNSQSMQYAKLSRRSAQPSEKEGRDCCCM